MADDSVRVEGLRPFIRALRAADQAFPRQIRAANLDIARDVVAGAKARATSLGSTAAKSAASLSARAQQSGAQVSLRARFGGELGAEFGAVRFRQFKPWRGSGPGAGYFVWPTIRAMHDAIVRRYERLVDDVTHEAFPD